MTPLQLAFKYMNVLYSENPDPESLRSLFATDLQFKGPLFSFNSAEDYINSLKKEPPRDFNYKLIQSYEKENSACLVYLFKKQLIETQMAQVFEVNKEKIKKIYLIFDSALFR